MGRPSQALRFLWEFLKNPFSTGAIAPSSRHLARMITSGIGLAEAKAIIEFGAGTGVFTQCIIQKARPDAQILLFERNPSVASMLLENIPCVDIIVDSAANLQKHLEEHGITEVDCVVCGLPWASFSQKIQDSILNPLVTNLASGGRFATFAYVHACWFPSARRFRARLQSLFAEVEASPIVWLNVPPAFVWRCTK